MCFITSNFVFKAKCALNSLNLEYKNIINLTISDLNYHISEILLSLDNDSDAFIVYHYYHQIVKHLKKIKKAFTSDKYNSIDDSLLIDNINTSQNIYDNIIIVTNIFSNKMNSIYYENSKIVIEDIKKDKSKNNLFDTVKDGMVTSMYMTRNI